jgi:hypothetical protein
MMKKIGGRRSVAFLVKENVSVHAFKGQRFRVSSFVPNLEPRTQNPEPRTQNL